MNRLDQLEQARSDVHAADEQAGFDKLVMPFDQLLAVARAAQKIDLRVGDIPIGPTRTAVQQLHLALSPLLEELPE